MKRLNELFTKVDALTPRERLILFVMLLAGLWLAVDGLLLGPLDKARKAEHQKLATARESLVGAQEMLNLRLAQPDPNAAAHQRLEAARQALEARMKTATALQDRMVAPRDMVRLLQGMLANQPGLRLVSLKTLPPEPVGQASETKSADAPPAEAALYRHGVTLTLTGDYATLTHYMGVLEKLPAGFYWAGAELDASRHPVIELTLTLHTLSLERTWLEV